MNDKPSVYLSADCLMSKWGFNDGDEPDNLLDYWIDHPGEVWFPESHLDWDGVLRLLVRRHLVPAIEQAGHTVEVYDIETAHNPVRARVIDGIEIDDYHGHGNPEVDVAVSVPYEDVMAAVREVMTDGD
jgi:hypothetical protein